MSAWFSDEQEAAFDALGELLKERNLMRELLDLLYNCDAIGYNMLVQRGRDYEYHRLARELHEVQQRNKANEGGGPDDIIARTRPTPPTPVDES